MTKIWDFAMFFVRCLMDNSCDVFRRNCFVVAADRYGWPGLQGIKR